jgi:hypothetical protein
MKICQYTDTCTNKTENCWRPSMTEIHAKPVVDGKFWIVEENGSKVGVLKITEQKKYIFSSKNAITTFDTKKKIVEQFGPEFFIKKSIEKKIKTEEDLEVHGYATSTLPFNPLFDVKRHLPLFTKSNKSKSVYCAGYYIIKFDKGWVRSFCPKLITIERYPYEGPFKTEIEMKHRLSNARK